MAATAERTTIATTGLTKRYDEIVALDEVSLEIADDAIGLLGANGAGKSTLMRALLGLVEPDAGSARLLGIDAVARGLELRRRIGYMPEHECLPSWMTARDLVVHLGELRGLPRRIAVLRTSEVLFQVGLGGVAQAEPRVLGELCARYELEMDPGSVPGLLERFGLRIGEPQA